MFAAATPTAAADLGEDPGSEGVEDSGFPPCQVTARDPEGSFTLAAAEGGGHDSASATVFLARHVPDVSCQLCQVGELPLDSRRPWVRHPVESLCERLVVGQDVESSSI